MPHIHTQPGQHDFTASAFIIHREGSAPRILLHMHKKLHQWMQMGGHVELHETPWAAVIHEIREESGYDLDQLRLLQPPHAITDFEDKSVAHPVPFLLGTHPFGADETHFHTDMAFVFVTDQEPRHHVSDEESTTLKLFTRQEVENLPPEQIPRNLRVGALYIFDRLLEEWNEVDPTTYATTSLTSN